MQANPNYHIKLEGYCSIDKESLLKRFIEEGPSNLTDLEGEYTIVIEDMEQCYIITSAYGIFQYYYLIHNGKLFHGDTILDILKRSQLRWKWNWKALADLIQLDHVLENDTLHPQISRVPPRSVLHFKQGILKTSSLTWEELNPPFPANPDMALAELNKATKQWISDDVVLSLSGGFDSRAILSSLLKLGCKPFVLTMGFDNSTDVVICQQIASTLDLPLSVVALNVEDYLKYGSTIAALTNGTQIAEHWHAYIYVKKANLDPDRIFFVGVNGEFARSYYLDKGIVALTADMVAPLSLLHFWKRSLKSIFKKEELRSLHPELSYEVTGEGQDARVDRIIRLCYNRLLSGLDRFYLEQRERNFFGNVFRLYSENVSWRAPFLSLRWINVIWNLKRNWKLGSNWHRFAITKNYPPLLNFPEAGKAHKMYSKAPLLYWHPMRKKYAIIDYVKYREWFQNDLVVAFVLENAHLLSELIEKNTVISIVQEHRNKGARTRTIAFLLTMIFWLINLKQVQKE